MSRLKQTSDHHARPQTGSQSTERIPRIEGSNRDDGTAGVAAVADSPPRAETRTRKNCAQHENPQTSALNERCSDSLHHRESGRDSQQFAQKQKRKQSELESESRPATTCKKRNDDVASETTIASKITAKLSSRGVKGGADSTVSANGLRRSREKRHSLETPGIDDAETTRRRHDRAEKIISETDEDANDLGKTQRMKQLVKKFKFTRSEKRSSPPAEIVAETDRERSQNEDASVDSDIDNVTDRQRISTERDSNLGHPVDSARHRVSLQTKRKLSNFCFEARSDADTPCSGSPPVKTPSGLSHRNSPCRDGGVSGNPLNTSVPPAGNGIFSNRNELEDDDLELDI